MSSPNTETKAVLAEIREILEKTLKILGEPTDARRSQAAVASETKKQ